MTLVLVTQRVVVDAATGERRDALDQRWWPFLRACGLVGIAVPNDVEAAERVAAAVAWRGVLLTGGNDLAALGGDAPERDAVEERLVRLALDGGRPVLGVCRGMQFLLAREGADLTLVDGHAGSRHGVASDDGAREVGSFHRFGCRAAPSTFDVRARAHDGVVEAVRHRERALAGLMWHPERETTPHAADVALFRSVFGVGGAPAGTR